MPVTGATWLDIVVAVIGIVGALIGLFIKMRADAEAKKIEQAKQDQDAEKKDSGLTDDFGKKVIDINKDIKKKQQAMDGWQGPVT